MAKVLGVGGLFFKAADPKGLAAWYHRVLGIEVQGWGGAIFHHPDRGVVVWTPFAANTEYFAPSKADFMVNLIVDDLDGVLAKVRAEGVEILDHKSDDANGKFAWLIDPAGIKLELWQPA